MSAKVYNPSSGNETCSIPTVVFGGSASTYTNKPISPAGSVKTIVQSSHAISGKPSIKFFDQNQLMVGEWVFPTAAIMDAQFLLTNNYAGLIPITFTVGDVGAPEPEDVLYSNAAMKGLPNLASSLIIYTTNKTGGMTADPAFLEFGTDFDLAVTGGGINLLGSVEFVDAATYTLIFP